MRVNKMKTIKLIGTSLFLILILFSCETQLALGPRLDLDGPIVEFTSPERGSPVTAQFFLEGTIKDESGIKELRITVQPPPRAVGLPTNPLAYRQWRYTKGNWEISDNGGTTWSLYENPDAEWIGNNFIADWKLPVDLMIGGVDPDPGQYTFFAQGWDTRDTTDDNSFKSLILIIDNDPPIVSIINPFMYSGYIRYDSDLGMFDDPALQELHVKTGNDWKDPALIGRIQTNSFNLQFQIDDSHNIWSIDLRFYNALTTTIDQDASTADLPSNYIYRHHHNTPPPPPNPPSSQLQRPNETITIPALESPLADNPISSKTTIMVVAVCYDAAGNVNQEKIIGYFIYWPQADFPWITYTGGLKPADEADHASEDALKNDVLMIYPGRTIRANAYHYHGVEKVVYSLYIYTPNYNAPSLSVLTPLPEYTDIEIINPPRPNGLYSTSFQWEIDPPPRSNFYVVRARSYSAARDNGNIPSKISEESSALFMVQDISFPDFPSPPNPVAGEPLFKFIENNKITISGIVRDATQITELFMVWINPQSRNFASMSQLQYFRNGDYIGWQKAIPLTAGGTYAEEDAYDTNYPNKVWKLNPVQRGVDPETRRIIYEYSITLDITDILNIGGSFEGTPPNFYNRNNNPLTSQTFLFRAMNPDRKTTIITYAPQGDTLGPTLRITDVDIDGDEFIPRSFKQIPQFTGGETITINGTWIEDSTQYLDYSGRYFANNFDIEINGNPINSSVLTVTKTGTANGTWTAEVKVGTDVPTANLKDTLVISASVTDIGGNVSEDGASWLIESEHIRLMRITSEDEDKTYAVSSENPREPIEIFLEFSKPVQLTNGGRPYLILNSTGTGLQARARYREGQNIQSTKHYFDYIVEDGHNTPLNTFLTVTGLYFAPADVSDVNDNNYIFTWHRGSGDTYEEIRLTMDTAQGYDGNTLFGPVGQPRRHYRRTLPTTTIQSDPEYIYTLMGSKRIAIDTSPLTITEISTSTLPGDYTVGAQIFIDVKFNKPVTLGTILPRLSLSLNNGTSETSNDSQNVRINNSSDSGTITFLYTVVANDSSHNSGNTLDRAIVIENYIGDIYDLAGNKLAANAISNRTEPNRTLTGRFIDTRRPDMPTLRVLTQDNVSSVLSQTVNNSPQPISAISGASAVNLGTVYNNDLWLAIEGNGPARKYSRIEYSISNDQQNFVSANNTNTPFSISQNGVYQIIARQTDRAGNSSDWSNPINFTWDSGDLIERIDSSSANGTYTNNTIRGAQQVNVTVYFRKPLFISGTPSIRLNATNSTAVSTSSAINSQVSQLSFTYTVGTNHNTPGSNTLNVTSLTVNATDGTNSTTGVNVSHLINFDSLTHDNAPSSANNLGGRKSIYIATGNLLLETVTTNPYPRLTGTVGTDGTWSGTITAVFNRPIFRGAGNVTVTQIPGNSAATNYRLPAVLTEAQYNRYRSRLPDIDTYYTRGTNGFNDNTSGTTNTGSPDTSAKYILAYGINTANIGTTDTDLIAFANAFRLAEAVSIPVNNVTINDRTLTITLNGSNVLQVPGATYIVNIPAGFVKDDLENESPVISENRAISGVARPFIRVNKAQDTIATATASQSQPRLVATQPMQTNVKIDCRTPGATIFYHIRQAETNTNMDTGNATAEEANQNDGQNWRADQPNYRGSDFRATPVAPDDPQTVTNNRAEINITTNPNGFQIGNTNYQGLQVYMRAKARTGTDPNFTWSDDSYEMAYRTVLSYRIRGMETANWNLRPNQQVNTNDTQQSYGDQIWIRGGDAIGTSTTPGFPLTWEDDWNDLSGKRAGIRLLTKRAGGNDAMHTNSIWSWVTWEVNVDVYFDIILGRDVNSTTGGTFTASSPNEAWQYGPRRWAYQRAGWTSYKEDYRMLPGQHRFLYVNAGFSFASKGNVNFSGTFTGVRPTTNLPGGWTTPNVTTPVPAPAE